MSTLTAEQATAKMNAEIEALLPRRYIRRNILSLLPRIEGEEQRTPRRTSSLASSTSRLTSTAAF